MTARRAAALAATAACLLQVAVIGACGGDGTRTYRNDRYGFSLTFDERFVEWREADLLEEGVFGVAFADPDGARAGDRRADAILVAVVDLGRETTPEEVERMREALQQRGEDTVSSLGGDVRTWPPADVAINGLPGVVVPFSVTIADTRVIGWDYLLVKGRYLYVIVATSGEETWERNKGDLQAAAESFTVENGDRPAAVPSGVD